MKQSYSGQFKKAGNLKKTIRYLKIKSHMRTTLNNVKNPIFLLTNFEAAKQAFLKQENKYKFLNYYEVVIYKEIASYGIQNTRKELLLKSFKSMC